MRLRDGLGVCPRLDLWLPACDARLRPAAPARGSRAEGPVPAGDASKAERCVQCYTAVLVVEAEEQVWRIGSSLDI